MGKKDVKSKKGQGETLWGEPKSATVSTDVTPTGKRKFVARLREMGLTMAEFIERVARGRIRLVVEERVSDLVAAQNLAEFTRESGMSVERLQAIANGLCPSAADIVRIARALDMDDSQLREIVKREFGEIRNGNGCTENR